MQTAIIILGHGSRRPEVSRAFAEMALRLSSRLGSAVVEPAFFSLGRPSLEEKAKELIARGYSRLVVFPYFLLNGIHVLKDIPEQIEKLKGEHPHISFELLPSLENDPLLEEVLFERLWSAAGEEIISCAAEIEKNSLEFIREHIPEQDKEKRDITARVVHATADFSFASTICFSPDAVQMGKNVLQEGARVFCDVRMLESGMTRAKKVTCLLDGLDEHAVEKGSTRAAAGIKKAGSDLNGSILVVGNSPTALWALMDLHRTQGVSPALVIGLPVGFVGAAQSKEALLKTGLACVTNVGPRGGSPAAAAAFNALCLLGDG